MNSSTQNTEWLFGVHTVESLLKTSPDRILRILVQHKTSSRLEKLINKAKKSEITIEKTSTEELDKLVEGNHQGICALCKPGKTYTEKWLYEFLKQKQEHPFLLILDSVTDPHNLGACLRSANAAGVDAVIIPKDNSATLTATATKVSSGAAEQTPLVSVTNLARCMKQLQDMGIWITGTSDKAKESLFALDMTGPLAIVMGAEDKGMRQLTEKHCDRLAFIPMQGTVSSLNVSVATGVFLFEACRQRQPTH